MALLERRITVASRDVDVDGSGNGRPDFLVCNPGGQVPVLVLDDVTWRAESRAIFQCLEERSPDLPLIGRTAEERALTRMWQRRIERRITEPLYAAFHLGPALDFAANIGWPMPTGLRHLERWIGATAERPAARASLHPKSSQTGVHYRTGRWRTATQTGGRLQAAGSRFVCSSHRHGRAGRDSGGVREVALRAAGAPVPCVLAGALSIARERNMVREHG